MTKNTNGAGGSQTVKLSDIKPDDKNPNKHSERGTYMLRNSMQRFGFLEPGVLDKDNRIIGGNSRTETAADILDAEDAIVIDIDGKRPVFVRRSDLDLNTPEGREASIALNRSAETGITWDIDVLADFAADGLELGEWWQDFELAEMGIDTQFDGRSLNQLAAEQGEPSDNDFWPFIRVQVSPETHELWQSLMDLQDGLTDAEKMQNILGAVDATVFGGY